jgi:hypothetical protein
VRTDRDRPTAARVAARGHEREIFERGRERDRRARERLAGVGRRKYEPSRLARSKVVHLVELGREQRVGAQRGDRLAGSEAGAARDLVRAERLLRRDQVDDAREPGVGQPRRGFVGAKARRALEGDPPSAGGAERQQLAHDERFAGDGLRGASAVVRDAMNDGEHGAFSSMGRLCRRRRRRQGRSRRRLHVVGDRSGSERLGLKASATTNR